MGTKFPKAALHLRARNWSERLRVDPRVIRVQSMTRKWGSCSRKGVVTLALDLASETTGVQDAVIVHELLHLKIRNHGRVFKALMTAYVPRWRESGAASCQLGDT